MNLDFTWFIFKFSSFLPTLTIKEKLVKKSFKSEKMSKDKDKKFAKRIVVPTTSASIIFTQITVGAICILLVNQPE